MKFVFSEKNGQKSLDRFDSIGGLLKVKMSFVISVEDCSKSVNENVSTISTINCDFS